MIKPDDGATVWIEYPEGRHLKAVYDADNDTFAPDGAHPIAASQIANWSTDEHEDTDISDTVDQDEKGKLTRS